MRTIVVLTTLLLAPQGVIAEEQGERAGEFSLAGANQTNARQAGSNQTDPSPPRDLRRPSVGFGYSMLRAVDDGATPVGWLFSLRWPISEWVEFVGQLDGNYVSKSTLAEGSVKSRHTFLDGLAFVVPLRKGSARFAPYGQLLLGVSHIDRRLEAGDGSTNRFTLQPGAGIDVLFSNRAAVRFELNRRVIHGQHADLQIASGVAIFVGGPRR